MMPREKFSYRRPTTTFTFLHKYRHRDEPDVYCASYSRLPSGRIGELWINSINGKEKLVTDDIKDGCVALSKDLQNGDTPEYLYRSLMRDVKGRASGWMGSAIDALRREPMDA